MENSKQVGGLVGPTLVAMLVAEFPLVQPQLYDAQIPPVIYLSGIVMFVAGMAVVGRTTSGHETGLCTSPSRAGSCLHLALSACSRPASICRLPRAQVQ